MPGELQVRSSTTVGYLEGNKTWAFPFFFSSSSLFWIAISNLVVVGFYSKDFYIIHEADAIPKFFWGKKIK